MRKALFFLIFFVISLSPVIGTSISHEYTKDQKTIFFLPGIQREYTFMLGGEPAITSYIAGDLSEYVTLLDTNQGGGSRTILVKVSIPEDAEEPSPGHYTILVGAAGSSAGGTIGTVARIQTPIWIEVLRPGKYAVAEILTNDVNQDEPTRMGIKAESFGKLDIIDIHADLTITDEQDQVVGSVRTQPAFLASTSTVESYATFQTTGLAPGRYYVNGNATYDGEIITLRESSFKIGTLEVHPVSYTKEVGTGGINKVEVTVESSWNAPIEDVYGVLTLRIGDTEQRLDKTSSEDLERFAQATLKSYWDTKNVPVGNYSGTITIFYAGQSSDYPLTIAVTDAAPTGKDVEEKKGISITPVTLYLIIAVLAIFIVVITLIFGRNKQPPKEVTEPAPPQQKA